MDWTRAIRDLERANAALIDCAPEDLPALEAAMTCRDRAVQDITGLDPRTLPPSLAARLKDAFEAGAAVRAKLAAIYRDAHAELRRTRCVGRFFESGQRPA